MNGSTFGLRLLSRPGTQIVVLGMLAVLALAFRAIQFAILTTQVQWGYDFSAYWSAAGNLLHGLSPYTAQQLAGPYAPQVQYLYLYPPPLAALLAPLAALFPTDYRAAAWIWSAIGAAILAWSVLALARSERLADRYPILAGRGRWLLVAGALAFPPVVGELVMGNVHLVLLGLLTLAWLGIRRGDSRGEMLAGVAIGVAAVVKVFPGVLVVWLLLTRRFRAAAWVVIGALAAVLVALSLTGIQPWREFPTVLANLSAPWDTTDTLAPTVWLAPYLGFLGARVAVTIAALAILAWASVRTDYPTGITNEISAPASRSDRLRKSAEPISSTARSFAIAVTVSVLVAPALYHHYLALLVLPFVLALGAGVPLRWLALAYFLMWGGQQAALGDLAFIVNRAAPTAGALVLLAALVRGAGASPLRGLRARAQAAG